MINLRDQAEQDLAVTLEDEVGGFGRRIRVIDPDGLVAELCGQSGDIHTILDPDTGQAVSGRVAHVALRISTLTEKGVGLPRSQANKSKKPWRIQFLDLECNDQEFSVIEARPDRTLGVVACLVGVYKQ